jgi:hypothetical protein
VENSPVDIHLEFPEAGGVPPASTFLLADGRGGASQLTVGGFPARDFHAAYLPGPGFGTSLRWASAGLGLELAGREMWLPEDPEEFAALPPDIRLESFDEDPLPRWRYALGEARVELSLTAQHGEAAVVLRVRVFGARPGTRLLLRPAFSAGPAAPGESPHFQAISAGETPRSRSVRGQGEDSSLEWLHPEAETVRGPTWDRAVRITGHWFRPALLAFAIPPGESSRDFRFSVAGAPFAEGGEVIEAETRRLTSLKSPAMESMGGERLARSLDRFVGRDAEGVPRLFERLPGRELPGLRGAMRALPHALLASERLGDSREILADAAARIHALLGGKSPQASTDETLGPALLEWVLAGHQHALAGDEFDFLKRELWPIWMELERGVAAGGIAALKPDASGLLAPPTGSGGGRLELNVLWHSALRTFAAAAARLGLSAEKSEFESRARESREAITAQLYDPWRELFLDDLPAAARPLPGASTLRALSLPYSILDPGRERKLLQKVREKLWNPRGIRLAEASSGEDDSDAAAEALVPALLGPWARTERRLAPPGGPTRESLARTREIAPARLLEGLLGHACPVLEARPPFGPHPEAHPEEVERAHLETDAETLSLFLPHLHPGAPAREVWS